jgi:hypothetical protein
MRYKRQYSPTAVSFNRAPGRFNASATEITTTSPRGVNQRQADADEFRRYQAQQQRDGSRAIETGARETGDIKDASSAPGRLLAPPFSTFLRAGLVAHLKRTFR